MPDIPPSPEVADEAAEDELLSALAEFRMANDDGSRITLDEVATRYGFDLDELRDEPDEETLMSEPMPEPTDPNEPVEPDEPEGDEPA